MPRQKQFYTPEQTDKAIKFNRSVRKANLALLDAAKAGGVSADRAYIKDDHRFGGKLVSLKFGEGDQVHPVQLKVSKIRDRSIVKASFGSFDAIAAEAVKASFGKTVIVDVDALSGEVKLLTSFDVSGQSEEELAATAVSYCKKIIEATVQK